MFLCQTYENGVFGSNFEIGCTGSVLVESSSLSASVAVRAAADGGGAGLE